MTRQKQSQQKLNKQPTKPNDKEPSELTFLEHVHELRKRLFWVVFVLVLVSAAGFEIKDQLIGAVMAPLHGQKLIYLTPGGGFSFIFTVSIYFGALFTIPIAVYQIYRFLQPVMGGSSRRQLAIFMVLSTLLAAGGAAFGYFVTIPAALNFLSNFAGDAVIPSLTADSYLNFVVAYVLGLALLFQLPLILFLIDHIHPLPPGALSSSQNWVIISATILAAVITPTPDAFNMALVAVPIIAIYEIGVVAVYLRRNVFGKPKPVPVPIAQRPTVTAAENEPLTAIIEELRSMPEEAPVVRELATAPATGQSQSQRLPVATPVQVASPSQTQPATVRSMDGFMRPTRQSPPPITVPSRAALTPARPAPNRSSHGQSRRSIDGIVIG